MKKILLSSLVFTIAFSVAIPFASNQVSAHCYPARACNLNKPKPKEKQPIVHSSMLSKDVIEKQAGKNIPSSGSAGFDAIITGIALNMAKANFWTGLAVAGAVGFAQDLASKRAEYFENILKKIEKGEIKGLKITVTQNIKSSYPAAYIKYEEVK